MGNGEHQEKTSNRLVNIRNTSLITNNSETIFIKPNLLASSHNKE